MPPCLCLSSPFSPTLPRLTSASSFPTLSFLLLSGPSASSPPPLALPSGISLQKRAALWALGHIAASPLGFHLLSESSIIPFISLAATSHPTLSFRGTCYYILSLIARSPQGRATLSGLGWAFSSNPAIATVVPADTLMNLRGFPLCQAHSIRGGMAH